MFANLKFRDVFSNPVIASSGLGPSLASTGSHGYGAIPVAAAQATSAGPAGNYANFKKWVALVQIGSVPTTTLLNAWWGGASASGGTYSMLPASSTLTYSLSASYSQSLGFGGGSISNYPSLGGWAAMEIRGEYINGLNSGITWIQPIVSLTNSTANIACLSLAFEAGSQQASFYDATPIITETDSF